MEPLRGSAEHRGEPHRATTDIEPLTGFMGMTERACHHPRKENIIRGNGSYKRTRHHPRRGSISVAGSVSARPHNPVRGYMSVATGCTSRPPQPRWGGMPVETNPNNRSSHPHSGHLYMPNRIRKEGPIVTTRDGKCIVRHNQRQNHSEF